MTAQNCENCFLPHIGFDDGDMAKVDAWVRNETLAQLLGRV